MPRKQLCSFTGVSEDGQCVIGGLYKFYETTGLPLTDIVENLYQANKIPDWYDYIKAAKAAGQKERSIKLAIEHACIDVYGKEHTEQVMKRVMEVLSR